MSNSRTTYIPRPDTNPEAEVSALAAVYKLILGSKKAAGMTSTDGDDTKERSVNDFRATEHYTR